MRDLRGGAPFLAFAAAGAVTAAAIAAMLGARPAEAKAVGAAVEPVVLIPAQLPQPEDEPAEGGFDPIRGAAALAPIVATFGALAVAVLFVVISIAVGDRQQGPLLSGEQPPEQVGFATSLLGLCIFSSFLGSFGFAALGAQRMATANLAPSLIFMAVPVGVAFISLLGAFQVLEGVYVPRISLPGVAFLLGGSVGATVFIGAVIWESPACRPATLDAQEYRRWLERQWLQTHRAAHRHAVYATMLACLPAAGVAWVILLEPAPIPGPWWASEALTFGTLLSIGCIGFGVFRMRHRRTASEQVALRPWEGFAAPLFLGVFGAWILALLPA